MSDRNDWEADPRPWPQIIKAWGLSLTGGKVSGARARVAAELRSPRPTIDGWYAGKVPPHEAALRRLMTLIDELNAAT